MKTKRVKRVREDEVKPYKLQSEFRNDPEIAGSLLFKFMAQEEEKAKAEAGGYHPI